MTTKFLFNVGNVRVYSHEDDTFTYQIAGQVRERRVPLHKLPYELQADAQIKMVDKRTPTMYSEGKTAMVNRRG